MGLSTSSDTSVIFEGVAALANAVMAGAVTAGVLVAHSQLTAWRAERLAVRRSQVAEELISAAMSVEDALMDIRNPLTSVPRDKASDKVFHYQQRYDKLASYGDRFQRMRDAQIRARAVLGITEIDHSVDTIFSARARVAVAIELLADYARDEYDHPDDRDHKKELRRDMSGSFSDRDELGSKIKQSVELIETRLAGIARYEENKR